MDFEQGEKIFSGCGLDYSKELHEKLEIYCDFLLEYNQNVNLTAITDPKTVWLKHFADSILLLKHAEIPSGADLIDVGTGAGFPSVPIKLYRGNIKITLLDSLNKRVVFLQKLCERLGIEAKFIHGRAEDEAKKMREQYDCACARAVAAMPVLCEYCIPFVKVGGTFLAMKGPNEDGSDAQNAAKILGGGPVSVTDYLLGDDKRRILSVKKISQTPTKYPRNSSQIKSKSL